MRPSRKKRRVQSRYRAKTWQWFKEHIVEDLAARAIWDVFKWLVGGFLIAIFVLGGLYGRVWEAFYRNSELFPIPTITSHILAFTVTPSPTLPPTSTPTATPSPTLPPTSTPTATLQVMGVHCLQYLVQPGDHLIKISQRFGTSLEEILRANPRIQDPNLIFAGQLLQICFEKR